MEMQFRFVYNVSAILREEICMETVKTVKMGINGEGIAYLGHKPVFVSGAFPAETAEIRIIENNERYAKAEAVSVCVPSPARREPLCRHADICGACSLIAMRHEDQCRWKKSLLEEALQKYGNVSGDLVRGMHTNGIETGYRTQCKLPVQMSHGVLTTGLYSAGTNHFHPFDSCPVHDPMLEKVRTEVLRVLNEAHMKDFDAVTGTGIRYLVLRTLQGKSQCTLVTGRDVIPPSAVSALMGIEGMTSVFQSINTERKGTDIFGSSLRLLAGEDTMEVMLENIRLALSPRSFFQLNAVEAAELYRMAVSKIDPCRTLVEAYCGVGAMSLMAAGMAEHVIGIESVPEAVENAARNAKINGITNARFLCADAAEGLRAVLREQEVDTLLADPPRSGMDSTMIDTILSSSIRKIIYISCNPATLARNLRALKKEYQVVTVIPYDLFPNTPHVESITVLQRNGTFAKKRSKRKRRKSK